MFCCYLSRKARTSECIWKILKAATGTSGRSYDNSSSNKVSLGKKPEKCEILWVNYFIMNPFLKTLMYAVGSAMRLHILWLIFIQQKNTFTRFVQQRSYVARVCIYLFIFLVDVGLLQLPLSPQQKLNTLRLLGSIIDRFPWRIPWTSSCSRWGVALQPSTKGSTQAHGSFNRTAKARSEERTNSTKDVVCNKPHSYEWPPRHIRPHYAPLFCCNLVRL